MDASPRAGDGLIRLDADGVVQYASPNALSAYHRLGLAADLVGQHLGQTTAELAPSLRPRRRGPRQTGQRLCPRETEVEGNGGVIQLRVIPLAPKGTRIGSLVLLRDVTELRRRERELITKDATIREIHHRVKNNLQTVAALLRLQARRMDSERGREALSEAVRRVGSIAIVHETLSQNLDRARRVRRHRRPRHLDGGGDLTRQGHLPARRPLRHPGRRGGHAAVDGAHRDPAERPGARLRAGRARHGRRHGGARGQPPPGRPAAHHRPGRRPGPARGLRPAARGQPGPADRPDPGGRELGGSFDMRPVPEGGTRVVLDVPVRPQR